MTDRIYALYTTMESSATAVRDLMNAGISSERISVITYDPDKKYAKYVDDIDDVDAEDGTAFGAIVGALTGLGVAMIPGVGPVLAAGPFAAALLAGIGAGVGAITGGVSAALIEFGVDEDEIAHYERILQNGGAVVVVDTLNDAEEDMAENILERYHPIEIED